MKYHIYQLTYNKRAFYIGRTTNPTRRHGEHKRDSKTGTELKYQFIREIGSEWTMDVIATYKDSKHNYEEFHIYQALCLGCTLTNMMAGSVYEEFHNTNLKSSKTYDNHSEYFKAVRLHQESIDAKKIRTNRRKKRSYNGDNGIFVDDMNKPLKPSPGLQAIYDKRTK